MTVRIIIADAMDGLRSLPDESVQTCVTSPPYWQKRDYEVAGQLGMERTPEQFVATMVDVFRGVRRTLRADGSLWLNVGDSYASGGNGGGGSLSRKRGQWRSIITRRGWRSAPPGYKNKDITGVAFKLAEALRADGWWWRQTIIWSRPTANEPNRLDRPSTSHEYLFLLTKSEDSAVRNPGADWWSTSVWTINQAPGSVPHPALMPDELAARCILAGSTTGGRILDPFGGAGTTGLVADRLQRNAVLIELNPCYAEMARHRIQADGGLHTTVTVETLAPAAAAEAAE